MKIKLIIFIVTIEFDNTCCCSLNSTITEELSDSCIEVVTPLCMDIPAPLDPISNNSLDWSIISKSPVRWAATQNSDFMVRLTQI